MRIEHRIMNGTRCLLAGAALLAAPPLLYAQAGGVASTGAQVDNVMPARANTSEPVVAGGQVPDEATRVAMITALRQVYGATNVIDRIEVVGNVDVPPNWSANVQKLLGPALKEVRKGQLQIEGTQVLLQGEVASPAVRQQLVAGMAASLNPTYTIKNSLRVPSSEQVVVDQAVGNRIIEFETGSATLTSKGRAVLDDIAPTLVKLTNKAFAIVGHTDDSGGRASNLALSQARAESVKGYLVGKGIDPATMTVTGAGPDQPIADNGTSAGRAKNRRIEFRVSRG